MDDHRYAKKNKESNASTKAGDVMKVVPHSIDVGVAAYSDIKVGITEVDWG